MFARTGIEHVVFYTSLPPTLLGFYIPSHQILWNWGQKGANPGSGMWWYWMISWAISLKLQFSPTFGVGIWAHCALQQRGANLRSDIRTWTSHKAKLLPSLDIQSSCFTTVNPEVPGQGLLLWVRAAGPAGKVKLQRNAKSPELQCMRFPGAVLGATAQN